MLSRRKVLYAVAVAGAALASLKPGALLAREHQGLISRDSTRSFPHRFWDLTYTYADGDSDFATAARAVPQGMIKPVEWQTVPDQLRQSIMAVARRRGETREPDFVGAVCSSGEDWYGDDEWYGVISCWR
jgi:hypothetical protein